MSDIGYRVLTQDIELVRITEDGNERIINMPAPLPPLPPISMQQIIRARMAIRDPQGVSEIVFIESMPEQGAPNSAYTAGDGIYRIYKNGVWQKCELLVSDSYIADLIGRFGLLKAEIRLIDFIVAGLNPADYLVSHSAGAESFSWTAFTEILNFYKQRKEDILEQVAADTGNRTGRAFKTKKYAVGGFYD